jgi:hypothetical protein
LPGWVTHNRCRNCYVSKTIVLEREGIER